jgi:hypothetical protein
MPNTDAIGGTLRPELPPMPPQIAALPVARGYPIPFFVPWVNGAPEFRAADARKRAWCVKHRACWVCGTKLPAAEDFAFLVGPMCAVNFTTAEPPMHPECAEWSARACPFVVRPHMDRRRNDDLAVKTHSPGGHMIERNPGAVVLWLTTTYREVPDGMGGTIMQMGAPSAVRCFAEGRAATVDEVRRSIATGIHHLWAMAEQDDVKNRRRPYGCYPAADELRRRLRDAYALLGAGEPDAAVLRLPAAAGA